MERWPEITRRRANAAMIGRAHAIRLFAALLFVAGGWCGDKVKVEFHYIDGAAAVLSDAAAQRFVRIIASKPREARVSRDGPSSKPMGYFTVGAEHFDWEGNAVHTVTGSTRKIWIDAGFTRMYEALRERGFRFSPEILEELVERGR